MFFSALYFAFVLGEDESFGATAHHEIAGLLVNAPHELYFIESVARRGLEPGCRPHAHFAIGITPESEANIGCVCVNKSDRFTNHRLAHMPLLEGTERSLS